MGLITEAPAPAMTAGTSPEELAVMRQAAGRLSAVSAGTGAPNVPELFGALAAPFPAPPPEGRAWWIKQPTQHWCY